MYALYLLKNKHASSLPFTVFLHSLFSLFFAFSHLFISAFPPFFFRFPYYFSALFILGRRWSLWIPIQLLCETSIYKHDSLQYQDKILITMRPKDLNSWKMCDYRQISHFHYCFWEEFPTLMQSRLPGSLFYWPSTCAVAKRHSGH